MWKRFELIVYLALLGLTARSASAADAVPSPAASGSPAAAAMSPIDLARSRIDTMLRTGHADPAWFSASFLAQIPASKVDEVIASVTGYLGAYRSVEFAPATEQSPAKFVARFTKGSDDVLIHFDVAMKIDGLLFRPPATS